MNGDVLKIMIHSPKKDPIRKEKLKQNQTFEWDWMTNEYLWWTIDYL